MESDVLERCIVTAKDAGCPKDQVDNLISSGYVPYPWQWKVHSAARECDNPNGPVQVGIGGARGPGKTHCIFAQGTLDDSQRVANLKGLFLRKTGKAAKESMDDLVIKVLAGKVSYEYANSSIKFPNGSKVILGGFKDDKDIDNYIGQEYDWIAIEEGNQLSAEKKQMLRGSLRTSKEGWRPRWYETFNPGGIGHGDVKTRYVEPYKASIEKSTRFIPANFRDNPNLNVEYVEYLEGLPGQLGKAWREGDFDIMAGQYFTEWNEKIHVCEPFDIPRDWKKICALDYGLDKPASLGWYAISPEGQAFKYRELYRSGLTYSKLAEEWNSLTPTEEIIDYMVCDPSIWNRDGRNDEGLDGAEIFETRVREINKGRDNHRSVRLVRGNNDRLAGWAVFHEALRPYHTQDPYDGSDKVTSKLQVFSTCTEMIRTMPIQIHDERNPEDLDTDVEDHAQDETRYLLVSRPQPSTSAKEKETVLFNKAMKRKLLTKPTKMRFIA